MRMKERESCVSLMENRLCTFVMFHVSGGSGGVVNSLDFCPASLKSLCCFYFRCVLFSFFFTMEGGDSEFANFTLPTLKTFLEVRSQNVPGNKQ